MTGGMQRRDTSFCLRNQLFREPQTAVTSLLLDLLLTLSSIYSPCFSWVCGIRGAAGCCFSGCSRSLSLNDILALTDLLLTRFARSYSMWPQK